MTTRLPVPDKSLPYEVNEMGEVRSLPRTILRKCRHTGNLVPYEIPLRILKYDVKVTGWSKLARVQLYNSELKYRICYYVAKLVYAVHNYKDYNSIHYIHYKDGNSLNCSLNNLYETNSLRP